MIQVANKTKKPGKQHKAVFYTSLANLHRTTILLLLLWKIIRYWLIMAYHNNSEQQKAQMSEKKKNIDCNGKIATKRRWTKQKYVGKKRHSWNNKNSHSFQIRFGIFFLLLVCRLFNRHSKLKVCIRGYKMYKQTNTYTQRERGREWRK